MRSLLIFFVVGIAGAAAGCAGLIPTPFPDLPTHPDELVNNRYLATSMSVGGLPNALVQDTANGDAVLEVDFGRPGMSISGCNGMSFDDWSVNDGRLLVKTGQYPGWTLIACPPDADAQDRWFGNFLSSGPTLVATENGLTLTAGDTQIPFVLTPDPRYP